jgi:hypothetical protein
MRFWKKYRVENISTKTLVLNTLHSMPFLGIKEIIDQVPRKQKWRWQGRLVGAFGTHMKPTK